MMVFFHLKLTIIGSTTNHKFLIQEMKNLELEGQPENSISVQAASNCQFSVFENNLLQI